MDPAKKFFLAFGVCSSLASHSDDDTTVVACLGFRFDFVVALLADEVEGLVAGECVPAVVAEAAALAELGLKPLAITVLDLQDGLDKLHGAGRKSCAELAQAPCHVLLPNLLFADTAVVLLGLAAVAAVLLGLGAAVHSELR